jgi:DMSO reductase family type II enzyme heme b subunit
MQPSAFVQANWEGQSTGITADVSVAAVHNGELLAFHLSWQDKNHDADHGDNSRFPDAAAIALPLNENSYLITMGAPGAGLNAWYWRAHTEGGRQVLLEGPGSSQVVDSEQVRTGSNWNDGRWSVVIARPLRVADDPAVLQLAPGMKTKVGVAVWEGGRGERGGIKAYTQNWTELTLEG